MCVKESKNTVVANCLMCVRNKVSKLKRMPDAETGKDSNPTQKQAVMTVR